MAIQHPEGAGDYFLAQDRVVTVLSVSHRQQDHERLAEILSHSNWRLCRAGSCREAMSVMSKLGAGVIICESAVPDGGWRWLLERLAGLPRPPVLVVSCQDPDDALWGEVLNLGAYDVLSKPFHRTEVTRIVSLAWLYWKDRQVKRPGKTLVEAKRGRSIPHVA